MCLNPASVFFEQMHAVDNSLLTLAKQVSRALDIADGHAGRPQTLDELSPADMLPGVHSVASRFVELNKFWQVGR